jgi:hypothetical protein
MEMLLAIRFRRLSIPATPMPVPPPRSLSFLRALFADTTRPNNVCRGIRQKENTDALIPCIIEPEKNVKPDRNWSRLIQKIAACPGHDPGQAIP